LPRRRPAPGGAPPRTHPRGGPRHPVQRGVSALLSRRVGRVFETHRDIPGSIPMDRRTFLKASSLIAAGGLVPEFLAPAAEKATPGGDRVLVVVEMTGGNDGLNMVIPHADDLYYKARPTLAIPKKRALRIDDRVGLHPRMAEMRALLDRKELAVVLGVGYPNP